MGPDPTGENFISDVCGGVVGTLAGASGDAIGGPVVGGP